MGYLGSKAASGAYQKIIALMPVHDTYIETHLGGGAVMLRKPPAARTIGFDIDAMTVEAFCQGNPDFLDRLGDSLMISQEDAVRGLSWHPLADYGRTMIYADPPYLHETRTSRTRYRCEYTRDDHIQLIEHLKKTPAYVMLSGYPSALYDELLPGWHTAEFQVMTRGGVRTEKLWLNYDPAVTPRFSGVFAGDDYEDRRRIKRKAERWREKYRLLPPAERLAVMAALSEVDISDGV